MRRRNTTMRAVIACVRDFSEDAGISDVAKQLLAVSEDERAEGADR